MNKNNFEIDLSYSDLNNNFKYKVHRNLVLSGMRTYLFTIKITVQHYEIMLDSRVWTNWITSCWDIFTDFHYDSDHFAKTRVWIGPVLL